MISRTQYENIRKKFLDHFDDAGIALTNEEIERIEIADFGLERADEFGLQLVTYVNTELVCAKEMYLMPFQICPEHRHPDTADASGKEETFRCRSGEVYLYVEGLEVGDIKGKVPDDKSEFFTVKHEIILKPGDQYTLKPDTLHWFQAGKSGAIISEFSTRSNDETDIWTDPEIKRAPQVAD